MKRLFLQVAHQVEDYDIQGPSLAAALILILFSLCVRHVQTRKVQIPQYHSLQTSNVSCMTRHF